MAKPKGTEAVTRSLLTAAIDDYASGRAVSVRATAKRAGVNHGQIHHLFGGKEGLKRAMLEALADEMDGQIEAREPADLFSLLQATVEVCLEDDRHVRALARQIVEGGAEQVGQRRFPVVERINAAIDDLDMDIEGTELYLAEGLARGLGWILFKGWICRATGIGEADVARLEKRLGDPLATVPLEGSEP